MNTAFDVLVIVLACLFGIFLIVSITVTVLAIKVVNSIRRVVAKGEQVVDTAEAAAEIFKKASGPLGILRTLTSVVETVAKHKQRKE